MIPTLHLQNRAKMPFTQRQSWGLPSLRDAYKSHERQMKEAQERSKCVIHQKIK